MLILVLTVLWAVLLRLSSIERGEVNLGKPWALFIQELLVGFGLAVIACVSLHLILGGL